jgi:predicted alpha/beta-fold hydrolase
LIINARNDPFLSAECYPKLEQHGNPLISLLVPHHGGHCGFTEFSEDGIYWSEKVVRGLIAGL